DLTHCRCVVKLQAAPERVGQQLFDNRVDELDAPLQQERAKFSRSGKRAAVAQPAGRVDGCVSLRILGSPPSDRVEILQGESQWVHLRMAARTDRIFPVQ